jgi:hypothetical protein
VSVSYNSFSEEDVKKFRRAVRALHKELRTQKAAREWLVKKGFATKAGKLPRRYRG